MKEKSGSAGQASAWVWKEGDEGLLLQKWDGEDDNLMLKMKSYKRGDNIEW